MDKRVSEHELSQNNSDPRYLAEQSSRGDQTPGPRYDLLAQGFVQAPVIPADQAYEIQRELQKEHIRVEILLEQIDKKRVLEAEIRRELVMLESELARSRATTGLLLQLPKYPGCVISARSGKAVRHGAAQGGLDVSGAVRASETSTFHRGGYGISGLSRLGLDTILEEERAKTVSAFESLPSERVTSGKVVDVKGLTQEFEPNPFQRESNLLPAVSQPMDTSVLEKVPEGRRRMVEEKAELSPEKKETRRVQSAPFKMGFGSLRISEVIPVTENGKEKKRIILMPNPEHVSDESKSGSKRKAETPPPEEETTDEVPQENSSLKKKGKQEWTCALCLVTPSNEEAFNEHLRGEKHRLKVASIRESNPGKCTIQYIAKKPCTDDMESDALPDEEPDSKVLIEQKKTEEAEKGKGNSRFWCDLCQIGTPTQQIMDGHKRGKKHMMKSDAAQWSV